MRYSNQSNFDKLETLLSNLIQDYSIWHSAINSIVDSFQISKHGQKTRKTDEFLFRILAWYIFYNDKNLYQNVIQFLGGHVKSRKNGMLQKSMHFLEYLVEDPKNVILQLYASLTEHYDVTFVEENILPRYNYNFIEWGLYFESLLGAFCLFWGSFEGRLHACRNRQISSQKPHKKIF